MNKILLTTLLLTIFTFITYAQTEQGGWLVGASTKLAFTSTSFDGSDDNVNEFDLTLSAGNFVADNLVLGLNLSYNSLSDSFDKQTTSLVGPFFRYYAEGTFFLGASYLLGTTKLGSGGTDFTFNGNYLGLEAGYPIWVTENIAIEPSLNYAIGGGDFDGSSALGINIGFGLYLK